MTLKCCSGTYKHRRKIIIAKQQSKEGSKSQRHAKKIIREADKLEPFVIADIQRGLVRFKSKISEEEIAKLVDDGKIDEIVEVIPWDNLPEELEPAAKTMALAAVKGGELGISLIKRPSKTLGLDTRNPNVINLINNTIGNQIVDMKTDAMQSVKTMVNQTLNMGLNPKRAAKLIKSTVGLTEKQTLRIMNKQITMLRKRGELDEKLDLLKLSGKGKTTRANKIKANLKLLTDSKIEKTMIKDAIRAEKNRAMTIARTEITNVVNEGQILVWEEAKNQGLLPEGVEKEWVAVLDGDTTEICLDLDGQRRPIEETFYVAQTGRSVQGPSAHPNCRSGLVLRYP